MAEQITQALGQAAIVEQQVTPWDVHGEVVDGVQRGIDYTKIMRQFGCQAIAPSLIERLEKITGKPAHPLIKRGIFYCHRDFEKILDLHEQGKPFYLYTGRGPSSESMHLGHMIPFVFCQYLQEAFGCHLVIQMTDDEKFLFKDLTLEECQHYAIENAKDIIACGFDPKKTFIFANTKYFGHMYETVVRVQKLINYNQVCSVFGFDETSAIGKVAFPATQIAPSFSVAFPHLFDGKTDVPCLIPYAIDQDPYFRVGRDIAPRLKYLKPASLCSSFFPALQGFGTKMSASSETSAIFMTDTPKQIKDKINKYAFSGGRDTAEDQKLHGADIAVDIAYQYLKFFHPSEEHVATIGSDYAAGKLLTGQVKAACIECLQDFVGKFQEQRAKVDAKTVAVFMRLPSTERERELIKELERLKASIAVASPAN